jgi:hypothetical protein
MAVYKNNKIPDNILRQRSSHGYAFRNDLTDTEIKAITEWRNGGSSKGVPEEYLRIYREVYNGKTEE